MSNSNGRQNTPTKGTLKRPLNFLARIVRDAKSSGLSPNQANAMPPAIEAPRIAGTNNRVSDDSHSAQSSPLVSIESESPISHSQLIDESPDTSSAVEVDRIQNKNQESEVSNTSDKHGHLKTEPQEVALTDYGLDSFASSIELEQNSSDNADSLGKSPVKSNQDIAKPANISSNLTETPGTSGSPKQSRNSSATDKTLGHSIEARAEDQESTNNVDTFEDNNQLKFASTVLKPHSQKKEDIFSQRLEVRDLLQDQSEGNSKESLREGIKEPALDNQSSSDMFIAAGTTQERKDAAQSHLTHRSKADESKADIILNNAEQKTVPATSYNSANRPIKNARFPVELSSKSSPDNSISNATAESLQANKDSGDKNQILANKLPIQDDKAAKVKETDENYRNNSEQTTKAFISFDSLNETINEQRATNLSKSISRSKPENLLKIEKRAVPSSINIDSIDVVVEAPPKNNKKPRRSVAENRLNHDIAESSNYLRKL